MGMDLGQLVAEAARRHGDRPAFVTPAGWSLSHADLDRLSAEAAAGLAAAGVGPGTVAALTVPSDPAYPVLYLALDRLGAVTAGVNPRFTAAERARALAVVGPDIGDVFMSLTALAGVMNQDENTTEPCRNTIEKVIEPRNRRVVICAETLG